MTLPPGQWACLRLLRGTALALAFHLPLKKVNMSDDTPHDEQQAFGVFKPVGHVVISFPTAEQADEARAALARDGIAGSEVRRLSDQEMLTQIERDMQDASPLASIGQEMNLVKAHRALAERGYHWLVVHAPKDELARQVAATAQAAGAERAQLYGHLIIEELIEHSDDLSQVSESPDRQLDAQTPSGKETERAEIRPVDDDEAPPDRAR